MNDALRTKTPGAKNEGLHRGQGTKGPTTHQGLERNDERWAESKTGGQKRKGERKAKRQSDQEQTKPECLRKQGSCKNVIEPYRIREKPMCPESDKTIPTSDTLLTGRPSGQPLLQSFQEQWQMADSIYPNSDCGHRTDPATRKRLERPQAISGSIEARRNKASETTKEKPLRAVNGSVHRETHGGRRGRGIATGRCSACFAGCEA